MPDAPEAAAPPSVPRHPWHRPTLQCLGAFKDLTRCSGGQPSPDLLMGRQKQAGHSVC